MHRIILILTLLSIAFACTEDTADIPAKPNIILIVADDLGWHDLGSYGNEFIETPHLDSMARAGIRYTNAYAAASLCSPSRAALMTGLHPVNVNITEHIHGPFRPSPKIPLITPNIDQSLKPSFTTIGEVMRREGYQTAYIGKWHLGGGPATPDNQGFETVYAANYHGLPNSFYYPFFNHGMEDIKQDSKEGDYLTDKLTDRAISYLAEQDTFFMVLSYYAPHVPIEGPKDLVEKYIAKRGGETGLPNPHYAAMVEGIDRNVGRLMQALKAQGKLENTVVMFTSDNGGLSVEEVPAFAAHTPPTDNGPLRAGKGYVYEGGIRVPLLLHWPKYISQQTLDVPVVGSDFFATISALINRYDTTAEANVIVPGLRGAEPEAERTLVWHVPHYSPQGGKPASAIRQGNYKLIYFYEDQRSELYNLAEDPSEERDLSREQPERTARMLEALNAWKKKHNAQEPIPNPNYTG
jgi:arylsulfatase A-like enzyme